MKIGPYIKEKQPFIFRTFSNALSTRKLAHAYFLSGEAGTPLLETAIYLAKSILCDHPSPLADEDCLVCQRIERGEYPDVAILDGSQSSIKKDDIALMVNDFQKTALESKGIMVYIIHEVENMTTEAVNSLLKFLEEPSQNTYAILTSQNEAKVLPTIISRAEVMRLLLLPRLEVIAESVSLGCAQDDAEILSYFFNNGAIILSQSKSDDYLGAKQAFEAEINALIQGRDSAVFTAENIVAPLLKDKASARFWIDMLSLVFEDIVAKRTGNVIKLTAYDRIIGELASKLPHPQSSLLEIMTVRGQIELNISTALLLDHLINYITKE